MKGGCSLPSAPKGSHDSRGSQAGADTDGAMPLGAGAVGSELSVEIDIGTSVGAIDGAEANVSADATNGAEADVSAEAVDVGGGGSVAGHSAEGGIKVAKLPKPGSGGRPRESRRATAMGSATAAAPVPGKPISPAVIWTSCSCSYRSCRSLTPTPRSLKKKTTEEPYFRASIVGSSGTYWALSLEMLVPEGAVEKESAGTSSLASLLIAPGGGVVLMAWCLHCPRVQK